MFKLNNLFLILFFNLFYKFYFIQILHHKSSFGKKEKNSLEKIVIIDSQIPNLMLQHNKNNAKIDKNFLIKTIDFKKLKQKDNNFIDNVEKKQLNNISCHQKLLCNIVKNKNIANSSYLKNNKNNNFTFFQISDKFDSINQQNNTNKKNYEEYTYENLPTYEESILQVNEKNLYILKQNWEKKFNIKLKLFRSFNVQKQLNIVKKNKTILQYQIKGTSEKQKRIFLKFYKSKVFIIILIFNKIFYILELISNDKLESFKNKTQQHHFKQNSIPTKLQNYDLDLKHLKQKEILFLKNDSNKELFNNRKLQTNHKNLSIVFTTDDAYKLANIIIIALLNDNNNQLKNSIKNCNF